jgi:hypothetical protein
MFMAAITGVTIRRYKGDEGSNNVRRRIQFLHLHERHVHEDEVCGAQTIDDRKLNARFCSVC